MSPVPSPHDTLGPSSPDQARSGEADGNFITKSSAQPHTPRESAENRHHPGLQQGVLADGPSTPMTPTRLVSTSAPPIPPNWLELALKGRAAALREAQRKTAPSSLPADMQQAPVADPPTASSTSLQTDAVQNAATQQSPVVKTEPDVDMQATAPTLTAPPTEASLPDGALAGGLVSANSPPPAPSTSSLETSVASVQPPPVQPPPIAALALASQDAPSASGPDALRTEIMGPPPSLPLDLAYPPLNPVTTEATAPPTTSKRRGPAPAANGAARRSDPVQAPADFEPPTNLNGKMPYALFQTVQKSAVPASKSAQTTLAAQRYVHNAPTPGSRNPHDFISAWENAARSDRRFSAKAGVMEKGAVNAKSAVASQAGLALADREVVSLGSERLRLG